MILAMIGGIKDARLGKPPYLWAAVAHPEKLASNYRAKPHKERSQAETAIVYQRIVNSLASRWREFAVAVERSHDDPCEHVIHRMRIAAKRLRYLTEVMGKLHIAGSTETLNWLKSLQGTIGVWHDLEIMERMLREIVAHRKSFKVEHLTAGTHLKAHSPQQFDQEKISRHVFSDDP